MTLIARQLHNTVTTVLDSNRKFTGKEQRDMLLQIGAVLPLPMCHTEGGARHAQKSNAMDFVNVNCPDAVQEGPFYDSEGHVVDFPTEVHRTPPPRALEGGVLGFYITSRTPFSTIILGKVRGHNLLPFAMTLARSFLQ